MCVLMVGDDGNAREVRLTSVATRDVATQPQPHPMSIGVTESEAAVKARDAIAEMTVNLAAQFILRVERLGNEAKRHGFAGRLQAKHPIHRRRPPHMTPRKVPPPDATASQRLIEL